MMRNVMVLVVISSALLAVTATARAAGPSDRFDAVVRRMLEEYVKVHRSLAADTTRAVGPAARALEKLASELQAAPTGARHADKYRALPAKIRLAAQHLSQARSLPAAREAMKELSRPFALWAALAQPADFNVVYCSMAKASWLQREAAIRNPYYGAQMLRCGEVVSGPAKGQADGHMKH